VVDRVLFIIDLSIPISSNTFKYRSEWGNHISTICSTNLEQNSTVYRFNLCSHSGTYIETSQHKLPNDVALSDFSLQSFVRDVTLVKIEPLKSGEINLNIFLDAVNKQKIEMEGVKALLVCSGWTFQNYSAPYYLEHSPYFTEELTKFVSGLNLELLGVDTPILDNPNSPYNPVKSLFEANPKMLLLAPLSIDLNIVLKSSYTLNCVPLKISNVAASLCRPILIINS
jgi:kynurenine formamidase